MSSWGCVSAIDSKGRTIWITESGRPIIEANSDSAFAKAGLLSDESVNGQRHTAWVAQYTIPGRTSGFTKILLFENFVESFP